MALALVLWGEVSVEGPLVEVAVNLIRGRKSRGIEGEGREEKERERREPRDEYERLVWWIKEWVGVERVPGIEALRKWRSVVRGMREPGVRAARVRQVKQEEEEKRNEREERKMRTY